MSRPLINVLMFAGDNSYWLFVKVLGLLLSLREKVT